MPLFWIKDLPESVRGALPKGAQKIYLEAFNNAFEHYKKEETAFKVAWFAVKKVYKKGDHKWVKR